MLHYLAKLVPLSQFPRIFAAFFLLNHFSPKLYPGTMFMNLNLKIAQKLPAYIIGAALATGIVIGGIAQFQADQFLTAEVESKLTGIMESRKAALESYLGTIQQDLRAMSVNTMTQQSLESFAKTFDEVSKTPLTTLQALYITNNSNANGEKHLLDRASDTSAYSDLHGMVHPKFRILLEERGYYDIFLVNTKGDVIYSVFKELDYATNLVTGEWRDSDLGVVFRDVMAKGGGGSLSFTDFRPYAPSADAPASFMAAQVKSDGGDTIGALIFQMPIGEINKIMQQRAGLGESGESYIVGKDFLMRSDSRFSEESTILKTKVDSGTTRAGLSGKTGLEEVADYRGIMVLSAFAPLKILGVDWVVLTEIDSSEAFSGVASIQQFSLIAGAVVLLVIGFIGFLLARTIAAPMNILTNVMTIMASGDNKTDVPFQDRFDELGNMGKAVQVFKDNAIEKERLEAEEAESIERRSKRAEDERARDAAENTERAARQERVTSLTTGFGDTMGEILGVVSNQSTEMEATAQSMSEIAKQTMDESVSVSTAAEQASASVQTVASAAEELSSSIGEISRQVSHSSEISSKAVSAADETNTTIRELAEAAQKVGDVVDLINDIAEQTNLLALNATIEAARAGDAGKGFAVVASEVKNLATQTAKATEDIGGQITQIQGTTDKAVSAIEGIGATISEMNEIATAIAAAVEEQGAATGEISRNVQEAASGTESVSKSIVHVREASEQTGTASGDVLSTSRELAERFSAMQNEVESFLKNIKET
jgi:methyl-accepting chemotaxis protein